LALLSPVLVDGIPMNCVVFHDYILSSIFQLIFLLNNSWEYVGGTVDQNNNLITFDSQALGIFGIFPANKSLLDEKSVTFSHKYLTLDQDGNNECMTMVVNPKGKKVELDINLYDISGNLILDLVNGVTINDLYPVIWCGKNKWLKPVSIGPYIYEVRFNGEKEETGILLIVK
jgi:hypothetical protein